MRSSVRLLLAAALALFAAEAWAQDGALRIVLGYPAGASSDILARLLAEEMRRELGRPVIVENKAGACGRGDLGDQRRGCRYRLAGERRQGAPAGDGREQALQ